MNPDDWIEVRPSGVHGLGAFARQAMPKGHTLGYYGGRRYSARQSAARDWDPALTYVFGLSDGSVIDGSQGGNAAAHLNHSCRPNCAAFEVNDAQGRLQVVLETRRRIAAGEELFIDYALDVADHDPRDFPCHCGAPRCRGSMVAPR